MDNAKALDDASTLAASALRNAQRQAMLDRPDPGAHIAQVYDDDAQLADSAGRFARAGLRAGDGVLLLCSLPRWDAIRERLAVGDIDLVAAAASRQILRTGANRLLLSWMSGHCTQEAFDGAAGDVADLLLERSARVRVYSELADVLLEKGSGTLAASLQRCWNDFIRRRPVCVLSAWRQGSLDATSYRGGLESLYLLHDAVLPAVRSVTP